MAYDPENDLPEPARRRASIAEGGTIAPILFAAATSVGLARSDSCGQFWTGPLFQSLDSPAAPFPSFSYSLGWYRDVAALVVAEAGGRLHVVGTGPILNSTSSDGGRTWQWTGRVLLLGDAEPSAATLESVGFSRTIHHRGYARVGARAGRRPGVLAWTDDGVLWREIRGVAFGGGRQRFLVDPDPSIVYAVRDQSLQRLTYREDVGTVDTVAEFASEITATAMSPDGARLYVATAHHGLHLSRDRGATWATVDGPAEVQFWRGLEVSALEEGLLYGFGSDGGFWIHREPIDGS